MALLDRGLVEDPGALFALTERDLEGLPGYKARSIANLLDAIRAAKNRPIHRLLFGFGIHHVGAAVARQLAEAFGSIEVIAGASVEELKRVAGVGDVVAAAVREYFDRPDTRTLMSKLKRAGVRLEERAGPRGGPLANETFVVTGTLATMSREEAKERIEALGGKVGSSVSRNTRYLVVGDDPGSKLARARELDVPTLDEAGFLALLGR
jgi:DNA ligase (NAD+)